MKLLSRAPHFLMVSLLALSLVACSGKKKDEHGEDPHAAAEGAHGEAGHGDQGHGGQPASKWTYDGATGPEHWAQLGGKSALCGSGQRQSPVDITLPVKEQFGRVVLNYNSVPATIQNTGKTVRVAPQNGGTLELDGVKFPLKYVEFHSPSEHAINGHHSTLESQFVHVDDKGHTVIIAVLYDIGVADPALASLWTYLPSDPGQPVPLSDLLFSALDLLPGSEDFYVYSGSLTTPPCTEEVTWMVYTSRMSVSAEQADAFQRLIGPNARPLRPQNGRDFIHLSGTN